MLYYLFDYLEREFNLIGASVFRYISFRAGMAALISLLITVTFGQRLIGMLKKYQLGEEIRDLGLKGQMEKKGTPTMGGIIIIMAIVVPTLLLTDLSNIYIILVLITTLGMGFIGFLDDLLKLRKKNKDGLAGWVKVIGQVTLGLVIGLVLVFHEDVTIREFTKKMVGEEAAVAYRDVKALVTTIPFIKDNELDYSALFGMLGTMDWVLYVLLVIFIFTAVSNGANITDGVDGLAAGTSAIIALALAIFAYVSGNVTFSQYLNVMFIPNSGELVIFCTALVGACVGFLWYNVYPAQVFMGDTGSLSLGGIIAVLALIVRKELLIPVICGVFLVENLSVVMQVSYFKYTKKKYGEGRRIFLMSPLHHHYQKKGIHEAKIVARFWIVGILLAILSLVTLKLR